MRRIRSIVLLMPILALASACATSAPRRERAPAFSGTLAEAREAYDRALACVEQAAPASFVVRGPTSHTTASLQPGRGIALLRAPGTPSAGSTFDNVRFLVSETPDRDSLRVDLVEITSGRYVREDNRLASGWSYTLDRQPSPLAQQVAQTVRARCGSLPRVAYEGPGA